MRRGESNSSAKRNNGTRLTSDYSFRRCVLPKSKTESRIKSNLEGDFKLEDEDVKTIDGLDKKLRFNDPSGNFGWNFYADLDGKESS